MRKMSITCPGCGQVITAGGVRAVAVKFQAHAREIH